MLARMSLWCCIREHLHSRHRRLRSDIDVYYDADMRSGCDKEVCKVPVYSRWTAVRFGFIGWWSWKMSLWKAQKRRWRHFIALERARAR